MRPPCDLRIRAMVKRSMEVIKIPGLLPGTASFINSWSAMAVKIKTRSRKKKPPKYTQAIKMRNRVVPIRILRVTWVARRIFVLFGYTL